MVRRAQSHAGLDIDKLSSNITAGLADPQLKARIKELGGDTKPMPSTNSPPSSPKRRKVG